ncbi:MAG: DUF4278 domain-containing protein [Geminocystis sp.]|nr:DUF4278 domain-containing protein [Geminocystis sp.]MDW8117181.1 DUF4278 domain-containing protein [Geminocystis sp.]MDW8462391.1 DUF4278 domain-containing protein [Geminocystis sp.]
MGIMDTKYRGFAYSPLKRVLEWGEGGVEAGRYRGCHWNYQLPRHVIQAQPKVDLVYRGVSYCRQSTGVHSPITDSITNSTLHQIHMENIRCNLERRIQVAKEKNDKHLLSLLQREYQELDLAEGL